MADLKAAVVGTGGAGRLHAAAYAAGAETKLVGVVSGDKVRAEGLAGEFDSDARGYVSVEEMLRVERPDVVSVATLEWDHEAPVLAALAAGAHVLCEKPMAHTLAAGERMVEAARRAGRQLGVNFNYRSVPAHGVIREEIARGGFGRVGLFSAQMHAYLWPHMLDLMRYWFGDPVEVTAAMVDEQELRPPVSGGPRGRAWEFGGEFQRELLYQPSVAVAAAFRYGDFVATMSGSALVPLERNFWSFALYGSEDALVVDRATRANLNGAASLGRVAEKIAGLKACSYEESFGLSVGGFVEAVFAGRDVPVTGEDGLKQMRLDAAVVEAVRSRKTKRTAGFTEEEREHKG
jgi:predicted dehydrogenase